VLLVLVRLLSEVMQMWEGQPNTEQVLLRLPKGMVDALIQRSAEMTLQRLERVSIQALIREVVSQYLLK
jgi:hypothetical protein